MEEKNTERERKTMPGFRELALFLLVLLGCGWFFSTGGWNQLSRYDAIFAFSENKGEDAHTFRIDRYLASPEQGINTGDWAHFAGHYYSNKSPGTTIFGAMIHAPMRRMEMLLTGKELSLDLELLNAWLLNLILSGLPLAFGAVCFRRLLLAFGTTPFRADVFTILLVFGTGMWPYSTQLWALPAVGAFTILSAYFYYVRREHRFSAAAAGACFGMAVLFDYSAGVLIPAAILGLLADTAPERWKRRIGFLLGGLPFAVIYLLYNQACFGNPLRFAFFCNNPAFVDTARAGGVAALPNLHVMLELLFGQYRGLFPAMPFLLFAIPGFLVLFRSGGTRRKTAIVLAVAATSLLLMNASFNGWHGGDAILPRYLIPSLPAWCFLAAAAPLDRLGVRAVFAFLALLSMVNMTAVTAGTPLGAPEWDRVPVYRSSYRNLLREKMGRCSFPLKDGWKHPDARKIQLESTTSLGERAGLSRRSSLLCFAFPAAVLLLLAAGPWKRLRTRWSREKALWGPAFARKIFHADTAGILLLLGGLLYFLLPGDVYFINDEPALLADAWQSNQGNRFMSHGFFSEASGFFYGPAPGLFYQFLLLLIPHDLILLALLKTGLFLLTAGYSLHAIFGKEREHDWRLPMLFLLFSPYFYLYVRCFWDNILLLPLTALFLVSLHRYLTTERRKFAILCALILLFSLLVHPMSASIAAAFAFLLVVLRRDLFRRHAGMLIALALIVILSVGGFLWFHRGVATAPSPEGIPNLLPAFSLLSFHGFFSYFLPNPTHGVLTNILSLLSLSFCGIFLLLGGAASVRTFRKNHSDASALLGIFSLTALLFHVLLLFFFGKAIHPHYGMPILIPMALLCGLGADSIRSMRIGGTAVLLFLTCSAFGLACFVLQNHRNGGGRGLHYGATLSNQLSVVRSIRREARPYQGVILQVYTLNERLFPHAFGFLYDFTGQNDLPQETGGQRSSYILPLFVFYSGEEGTGFIDVQAGEAVPPGPVNGQ